MKKRILAIILALAVVCALGISAFAADEETIVLRFGNNFVSDHPIVLGYNAMAERLAERTNGAVKFIQYPGEQLGNTNDCVNSVSTDTLDFTTGGVGMVASRLAALKIYDCPYVFRDAEHMINFSYSDVAQEMWDQLAKESNLRFMGVIYNGARYLTTTKVPVHTPADLNGLKLRVPDEPMGRAYGSAMGGTPTPMTFGEVYMGLSQGTIDAQENPLTNIIDGKLYEVEKYIMPTGHVLATQALFMSEASWERLSKEQQDILQEEIRKTCDELTKQIKDAEASNLQFLLDQGMELVEPDVAAFKEACSVVVDEYKDEWGEDLYDIVQSF